MATECCACGCCSTFNSQGRKLGQGGCDRCSDCNPMSTIISKLLNGALSSQASPAPESLQPLDSSNIAEFWSRFWQDEAASWVPFWRVVIKGHRDDLNSKTGCVSQSTADNGACMVRLDDLGSEVSVPISCLEQTRGVLKLPLLTTSAQLSAEVIEMFAHLLPRRSWTRDDMHDLLAEHAEMIPRLSTSTSCTGLVDQVTGMLSLSGQALHALLNDVAVAPSHAPTCSKLACILLWLRMAEAMFTTARNFAANCSAEKLQAEENLTAIRVPLEKAVAQYSMNILKAAMLQYEKNEKTLRELQLELFTLKLQLEELNSFSEVAPESFDASQAEELQKTIGEKQKETEVVEGNLARNMKAVPAMLSGFWSGQSEAIKRGLRSGLQEVQRTARVSTDFGKLLAAAGEAAANSDRNVLEQLIWSSVESSSHKGLEKAASLLLAELSLDPGVWATLQRTFPPRD
eukprot:5019941-Amphidinium_carterae.2